MPIVHVTMIEGKSDEQKRKLLIDLTSTVVDDLGVPPEAVNVVVVEVPASAWAHAGEPLDEKYGL